MSSMTLHRIISLYTYIGLLPIKTTSRKKFTISRFFLVFNVLKYFFSCSFAFYVFSDLKVHILLLRSIMDSTDNYSKFSKFLAALSVKLVHITSLTVLFVQFFKSSKIVKLLHQFNESLLQSSPSAVERFQIKWKKHSIEIFFPFCFILSIQLFTKFRLSFLSLGSFLILFQPFLLMTGFLSFMKTIEYLFEILIYDFIKCLQDAQRPSSSEKKESLLINYQRIYDLSNEFNKTFGIQVTLMTCCITVMTTIQVGGSTKFQSFQKISLHFPFNFKLFQTVLSIQKHSALDIVMSYFSISLPGFFFLVKFIARSGECFRKSIRNLQTKAETSELVSLFYRIIFKIFFNLFILIIE